MAKIKQADIARVKSMGFLWNRGTEEFSGRILTGNGKITAAQLQKAAECAEKFGNGTVTLTSRMTLELPGISYENIEAAKEFVAEEGLLFGGTGAKIRPVTACKGTTCVYGNYDTQALAQEIHEKYFLGWQDVKLPHKFKIAVGGCPNSCIKPSLNDFGIEGHREPHYDPEKCRGCKVCMVEKSCPAKAAKLKGTRMEIDPNVCTACGVCSSGKCPFGAVAPHDEVKYRIFVGGTWGKKTRMGTALSRLVSREEIFPILEKTMLWFKENAYQKERLGAAIDRVGVDKLEEALFGDDLLARKDEILAADVKERP